MVDLGGSDRALSLAILVTIPSYLFAAIGNPPRHRGQENVPATSACESRSIAVPLHSLARGNRGAHPVVASTQSAGPRPTTSKRTLVLVTHSASSMARCSNAAMGVAVFTGTNSVTAYFLANSRGLLTVYGNVVGPFTVPVGTRCDRKGWASAADKAAMDAGVDLSAYDIRLYVTPPDAETLCGRWRGWYDAATNQAWVNASVCDSPHYLSGLHARLIGENHGATVTDEFGDPSTVVGGNADLPENVDLVPTSPYFNAPGLLTLGWLPASNVQTVTVGGRYRIMFLESTAADIQVLKIHTAAPANDYYFSYRRAVGFDAALRSTYLDNTSVHSWGGGIHEDTFLLANIGDGQSWSDGRVTVHQTSHDATYAHVTVTFP